MESENAKALRQNAELSSQVETLKRLLLEQQARISALEQQQLRQDVPAAFALTDLRSSLAEPASLNPGVPASSGTSPSPGPSAQVIQNQGSSDERVRQLEQRMRGLGPLSFSGDLRAREEPSFGGPADGSLDRDRARFRARFNVVADLGKQFQAGFSLATGDVNDPISTNQTMGVFYTRKAMALDQAYVGYQPTWFKPLKLIAGKFRYPWYNTELTWDKDLNPEGAAETLVFPIEKAGPLERVAVVGFELPFAEEASTGFNKRCLQSMVYGGQLQTNWKLTSRLHVAAYSGYYDFQNADAIAMALAKASAKNPQTPWSGALPLASSSPATNSITTTASANVVTVGGKAYPTGVTNILNAQFGSKFGLFDSIVRMDWDRGNDKWRVTVIGDYVQNTRACANESNITKAPANTPSLVFTQVTNAACKSNQRRGYWAEARVGRLLQKGDWQTGYTRIFLEREAVISNFDYSDMRQGTNVTQHRVDSFYMFRNNIQVGFTALIGRPLGLNAVGRMEPWLTKLQFDTVYVF